MRIVRGFLAIIFALLIVLGIGKYYISHNAIQVHSPLLSWMSKKVKKINLPTIGETKKNLISTGNRVAEISPKLIHTIKINKKQKQESNQENNANDKSTYDNIGKIVLHTDFSTGSLTDKEKEMLLSFGVVGGSDDGDVVWLHYCDYGSSYCQKSYKEGIVYDYKKELPTLQYIYKAFPVRTKNSARNILPHEALLCAQQEGTKKQTFAFYDALYQLPEARNSKESLVTLAESFKIPGMKKCLDDNSYEALIQEEMKFVKSLFKVRALPANIFLNKKTNKWVFVPGYYTKEEVLPAIQYIR